MTATRPPTGNADALASLESVATGQPEPDIADAALTVLRGRKWDDDAQTQRRVSRLLNFFERYATTTE